MLKDKFLKELATIANGNAVLTNPLDLALYSYDAALDRAMPSVVVFPQSAEQLSRITAISYKYGMPYVARGAGTNLCGNSIPKEGGLVICTSRLNRILSIDPEQRMAVVEPGVVNLHLQNALKRYELFYAPDPASMKASTMGGNVATNAGGPKCLKYGVTSHHVTGLEVVMPDGDIAGFNVGDPGFDMVGLFVGSEGTLGVTTKITVKLLPLPEATKTILAVFPSIETAINSVSEIVSVGITPSAMEAMDKTTIEAVESHIHAGYPKDAGAVLLIEVDGKESELSAQIELITRICRKNSVIEIKKAETENERNKLWEGRRGAYSAMARLAPNVLVEDGTVPRNRLPEAVKQIKQIASHYNIRMALVFHAGDGNIHPQIIFDERNKDETSRVKEAGFEMLKACVNLGGTISGEHGIGTDKLEAMHWMFDSQTLSLFRRIKSAFDPENLCNPGKKIPSLSPHPCPSPHGGGDSMVFPSPTGRGEGEGKEQDETKKIVDYNAPNFTITVGAGIKASELKNFVASRGQYLHIDGNGSLEDIICGKKQYSPKLRDQIIGMRVRLNNNDIVTFGGKVMKNVAGYDAAKLMIDSRGTLGKILSVTLRLHPAPGQGFKRNDKTEPARMTKYHNLVKKAFTE